MESSMFAVPFLMMTIVVGALKSTISHVAWYFLSLHFSQILLIIVSLPASFNSTENFKNCSGVGDSPCTEGVFGIFRN